MSDHERRDEALAPSARRAVEVTLYTREGCHLCDDAERMLTNLAPKLGFKVTKRDIDADPALQQRFTDVVPVIAVGEAVVAAAPVDEVALGEILAAALG